MATKRFDEDECNRIYDSLFEYCHLDTLAMVKSGTFEERIRDVGQLGESGLRNAEATIDCFYDSRARITSVRLGYERHKFKSCRPNQLKAAVLNRRNGSVVSTLTPKHSLPSQLKSW
jgi:hypothetical protein